MRYWVLYESGYVLCTACCPDIPENVEHLLSIGYEEISEEQYNALEPNAPRVQESQADSVWDEMAAAYKEGVQEA